MLALIDRHPIIDDVLVTWQSALGSADRAYGGHAYRVFNVARRILGSDGSDDALAVASAFHDIGIWTDGTFDYLAPSAARARDYLRENHPTIGDDVVDALIANHHRLRRVTRGESPAAVDAFRRADLVDVSRGLIRGGVERAFLRELVAAFPHAGFHGLLVRTALSWWVRHPLRPFPMLRL